jgi:cell division protein FtsI (penicillin-binding protein 3)
MEKKQIIKRVAIFGVMILLLSVAIVIRLMRIQQVEGDDLRQQAEETVIKNREIQPLRGNIYDAKGNLLATSTAVYKIGLDPKVASNELWDENVKALADSLAMLFPQKSAKRYLSELKSARKKEKRRYYRIRDKISFTEFQRARNFPLLKLNRYKGGLVYSRKLTRSMPFGRLAERTIGYDKEGVLVGLEGAYTSSLKGEKGVQLMQKIGGGDWKPVKNAADVEPVEGADIISTIDIGMQDIAQTALLRQLEKYDAHHGSVVVMEVETGAIKAISNLGKLENGKYGETYNYAVGESTEPGSTFKLISMMVALEDGVIDTPYVIDTHHGEFKIHDRKIRDSRRGGYGEISMHRAFEVSSNIWVAKMAMELYGDKPQEFIDRVARYGMSQKLGIDISGEGSPKIKNTSDPSWSGVSLPWMAFGYELSMTPLQLLTIYNAIANDGEMLKPQLIKQIRRAGKVEREVVPEVLNASLCSEETLGKLQSMMKGVVKSGTAKNIYSEKYTSAGKTGTCKLNYWIAGAKDYQASFAGYFPAENPKYSCIVVVSKPDASIGYYGNIVAAPVFSEIRNHLYAKEPKRMEELELSELSPQYAMNVVTDAADLEYLSDYFEKEIDNTNSHAEWASAALGNQKGLMEDRLIPEDKMPDVRGMSLKDALFILENKGLKVEFSGFGKVKKQSLKPGTELKEKRLVKLKLS